MRFISEYVYNNIKLIETRNIIENILSENERKNGFNYNRVVKVESVTKFLDKLTNETKIIPISLITLLEKLTR